MADPADPRRLDPMALAALLVAIVAGWCPLTAAAAFVLGAIAYRRIGRAPGTLRGRGLAAAGMAVSTAILAGELWLLGTVAERMQADLRDQAVAAIGTALADAPAALRERAGRIESVTITRTEAQGVADPVFRYAFNAEGERATAFGVAEFGTLPGALPPRLVLRSVRGTVGDEPFEVAVTPDAPEEASE